MASQWPPKKNTAFTLFFTLYKNDGTVIANPGTYTKKVSIDGGAIADITADVTEEDTTYGQLSVVLSSDEMNGDAIWVQIKDDTSGCVPFTTVLYTAGSLHDEVKADTAAIRVDTETDGVMVAAGAKSGYSIATGGITPASFTDILYGRLGIVTYGQMQAGSTGTTAKLADATAFADDFLNGCVIFITEGTGAGQSRVITDWATTGDVATVDTWTTTPDNTSVYVVFAAAPASATALPGVNVIQAAGTAWGSGAITAASIAADAGTELGTAVWATETRTLTAFPTALDIADMVWDEALSGHTNAGSAGEALAAAGTAGDPWTTTLPGEYGAGTAGLLLGTTIPTVLGTPVVSLAADIADVAEVIGHITVTGSAMATEAESFTKTTGGAETLDYTETHLNNATTHDIADASGEIDVYYQFDIGATSSPVAIEATGRLQTTNPATGNSINLYAWNWAGASWDLMHTGVFAPTTGTTNTSHTETLLLRHVGTGDDAGLVRVRFYNTGLKSGGASLKIDRLLVEFAETLAPTLAAILEDTGTTLPGAITDVPAAVLSAAAAAPIDANVQEINDVALTGNGSTTPFDVA